MFSNFVCFLVFFFFSVIIRTRLECSIPKDHYINLVSPAVPLTRTNSSRRKGYTDGISVAGASD